MWLEWTQGARSSNGGAKEFECLTNGKFRKEQCNMGGETRETRGDAGRRGLVADGKKRLWNESGGGTQNHCSKKCWLFVCMHEASTESVCFVCKGSLEYTRGHRE